ncbi:MAG TPA: hypothetical protein VK463_13155 [Desulfomonilaceae bacterium]|nr:hypothetical protein [Desulfomonilaceae bacterium]
MAIETQESNATNSPRYTKRELLRFGSTAPNPRERSKDKSGHGILFGSLWIALVCILATAALPRTVPAADSIPLGQKAPLFEEKPRLIWLERSIAEFEKSLNTRIPLSREEKRCMVDCVTRGISIQGEGRQRAGETDLEEHRKEILKAELAKVEALKGTVPGEEMDNLVSVRSALAELTLTSRQLDMEIKVTEERKPRFNKAKLEQLVTKPDQARTPDERRELARLLRERSDIDSLPTKISQKAEIDAKLKELTDKEKELNERLKAALEVPHLREEYEKAFSRSGSRMADPAKRGYTLTELAIMSGDRQRIDELLQLETETGISSIKIRLVHAIIDQDVAQALELINIGADVTQLPGLYSALALANTFGQRKVSAVLASNGAWVETPWTMETMPPAFFVKAFQRQLDRIEAFSREIAEPHAATTRKIQDLKCRLKCFDATRPAVLVD